VQEGRKSAAVLRATPNATVQTALGTIDAVVTADPHALAKGGGSVRS
jgi:hypothetical protein